MIAWWWWWWWWFFFSFRFWFDSTDARVKRARAQSPPPPGCDSRMVKGGGRAAACGCHTHRRPRRAPRSKCLPPPTVLASPKPPPSNLGSVLAIMHLLLRQQRPALLSRARAGTAGRVAARPHRSLLSPARAFSTATTTSSAAARREQEETLRRLAKELPEIARVRSKRSAAACCRPRRRRRRLACAASARARDRQTAAPRRPLARSLTHPPPPRIPL